MISYKAASPPEFWRPVEGRPRPIPDRPGECRAVVVYCGVLLMDLANRCMEDHGVSRWEFFSAARAQRISYCRFDFMWRARNIIGFDGQRRYSLTQLGIWFATHGRPEPFDHTSILHGIAKWRKVRRAYLLDWIRRDNARMAQIHGSAARAAG